MYRNVRFVFDWGGGRGGGSEEEEEEGSDFDE